MRFLRQIALIVSTLLAMLFGGTAAMASPVTSASAGYGAPSVSAGHGTPPASGTHDQVSCPTRNRNPSSTSAPTNTQPYYLDDWRLGPKYLPTRGPIGSMLKGYDRLDDFPSAPQFLDCYWNDTTSGWWFPDQDGFLLRNGEPIKREVTLRPGQKLDLFGSGFGRFLAPAGTDFDKRALPPSSLDTYDPNYPFSYHLYEVLKPFPVDAGPIRPWFGQPGLGLQYVVNSEYTPDTPNILELVKQGYLRQLN